MVIYKTINLINNKYYVGKQQTYTKSYLGSGHALKAAIKKYGKKNFRKEILEVCQSENELKNRELWWLDELNAVKDKNSYNLIRETSSNKHRSYTDPEYRNRLSISIKKILNTPESKARLRIQNGGKNNPMFGKKRSYEFKQIISRSQKGKILSPETKEKLSKRKLGISASNETKKKMRVSQAKRWNTIVIEMTLNGRTTIFDNRYDFISFVKTYNDSIPKGRVRGIGNKRINWKRAIKNGYDFIKINRK